jgi:zinc transport system substrate-binding protein
VRDDGVAAALFDRVDRLLEAPVGERLDLAAATADEMVVMPRVACCFVADDAVAEVDPLHEPTLVQALQHAVHARQADLLAALRERVEDLLRATAAILRFEMLEHERPGGSGAVAGVPELGARVRCPVHWTNDNENRYRPPVVRIVLVAVALLACAACGPAGGSRSVVAAFYPLAYAAREVGGGAYTVHDLTPAGAEPHDVELTPQAVAEIQRAGVVLYLSHGFQPAVSDAVRHATGKRVDVLAGLPVKPSDPHVWLDPVLYARIVRKVGAALGRPRAAAALATRVLALDGAYRRGLADCRRRSFVTSHAAFGYLAARYDLHQIAITGIDPESEPSPQKVASLARLVRTTRIDTVFFERLVSPKLAQTVAREAGVRTAVLDPIEGLTPAEARSGATYLSLMRRNLAALRQVLGCR